LQEDPTGVQEPPFVVVTRIERADGQYVMLRVDPTGALLEWRGPAGTGGAARAPTMQQALRDAQTLGLKRHLPSLMYAELQRAVGRQPEPRENPDFEVALSDALDRGPVDIESYSSALKSLTAAEPDPNDDLPW